MVGRSQRWTIRSVVERAREVLRQEGPRALFFRTLGEIAYRRVLVFRGDVAPRQQERPLPDGLRFEQLAPDSVDSFLAISQLCDEPEARRRLAAGHVCVLGYLEGRPVYCGWLALPGQPFTIDFLGIRAAPAPRCAYSYELYVDPACRRSGVASAGLEARIRLLRSRGVDFLTSVVVPENQAGISHTLAAGLRPVGRLHAIRILGFRRAWLRCEVDPAPLRLLPGPP